MSVREDWTSNARALPEGGARRVSGTVTHGYREKQASGVLAAGLDGVVEVHGVACRHPTQTD